MLLSQNVFLRWLKILAPLSSPIRGLNQTQSRLTIIYVFPQIFPRFAPVTRICFEFWLFRWVVCVFFMIGYSQSTLVFVIRHFQVLLCLCFKTSLNAKPYENYFCLQFHFLTNQLKSFSHLDSLWNRDTRELRNGPFGYPVENCSILRKPI